MSETGAAPAEKVPEPAAQPPTGEADGEGLWRRVRRVRPLERASVRGALGLAAALAVLALVRYPLNVTAECVILPAERRYVRAARGGVLAHLAVGEGAQVHKGDVLARLDDRELVAEQLGAQAQIERIRANLARLRKGARPEEIARQRALIAARESEATFARNELERQTGVFKSGYASQGELEKAERDVRMKEGEANEARASLQLLLAGTLPEEIAAEEAELKRAQAQLQFIDQQLQEMVVIRAPIDGVLLTPKFHERLHEHVAAGDVVCEIADLGTMQAEVFVPEREMDALCQGLPATIKVASYPTEAFEGRVIHIGATVEHHNGLDYVRVVAEIQDPKRLLKQNMTGYGEIHADRQPILSLMTRRVLRWIRVRFLI